MNKILIQQLKIPTKLGVHTWERQMTQHLICDLEIFFDFTASVQADSLEKTIDYIHLIDFIESYAATNHFQLIETFGDRLIEALFQKYDLIEKISLKLMKPAVSSKAQIGIEILKPKSR